MQRTCNPFDACYEQDPVAFLLALIQQYTSNISLINHSTTTETSCTTCGSITTSVEEGMVMNIPVTNVTTNVKMNDLLNVVQEQNVNKKQCTNCNAPLKVRTRLVGAHSLMVFKLDVWKYTSDGNKVRRSININSVPGSSIKIGASMYKLKASVHYEESKKAGAGYISIISVNGKWVHCKNQSLATAPWPKGAKDLYMLFYQRTSKYTEAGKSKYTTPSGEAVHKLKLPSTCTVPTEPSLKRKLDGHCDEYVPPAKKLLTKQTPGITINSKNKCKSREVHHSAVDEDCVVTGYEMAVV